MEPVTLEDFHRKHTERILTVKNIIKKEWIPSTSVKYSEHFNRLKNDFPGMTKEDLDDY